MKALLYRGPRQILCEAVDDARILDDRDAVIRMTRCGICGSDLHIYHGQGFSPDMGFCVGHEAVGEVVEVGRGVNRVKVGDRVMLPASVGCGECGPCLAGHIVQCRNNRANCYGLSHALEGCQAEYIRTPAADFNTAPIPEGLSEDQALMLTDNLPTAWFGLKGARIQRGDCVVVIGLGPIGLMGVEGAFILGAAKVFAVDLVAERRAIAAGLGAIALHPDEAAEIIAQHTHGRMADAAFEAVGADATIRLAISLVGKEGRVSVIGVSMNGDFHFDMRTAFFRGLSFTIGNCSVPREWPELVPLIQSGRLRPERYISHTLPLSQGEEAYRLFDGRQDGALKMVMTA